MHIIHAAYPNPIELPQPSGPYALAIGFFDGVHYGHQAVIARAREAARIAGAKLAVMTFDPHPSLVLGRRNEQVFYITPMSQKLDVFRSLGVDAVFIVRFTSDFAKLSPADFVDRFLKPLPLVYLAAGFDFTFGAKGAGTMEEMKRLAGGAFEVETVEKLSAGGEKVSSTRIRRHLESGEVDRAKELLGRPYRVRGVVVHGDKRGRTIGFPTANLHVEDEAFIPKNGVYAVRLYVQGGWHGGVCNVGFKPTFHNPDEKKISVEVHIADFDRDIYGEEVLVDWYSRLRDERRFDGIAQLKEQIVKDVSEASARLRAIPRLVEEGS